MYPMYQSLTNFYLSHLVARALNTQYSLSHGCPLFVIFALLSSFCSTGFYLYSFKSVLYVKTKLEYLNYSEVDVHAIRGAWFFYSLKKVDHACQDEREQRTLVNNLVGYRSVTCKHCQANVCFPTLPLYTYP